MRALRPRQIAYFVPDIEIAAKAHSAAFGSGPFFVFRHVPLSWSKHRGIDQPFDHSSAYGQWGDVMVEFVQQHNSEPSACHDIYPAGSGRFGLHHIAVWVENLREAIAEFAAQGTHLAQHSCTSTGMEFAFLDAVVSLGHMIEIYEGSGPLKDFYAMVHGAAQDWDSRDLFREL